MVRLIRSAWAGSRRTVFCDGALAAGGPEGEEPPDEVSTAHPERRLSPPTRETRAVAILSLMRDMIFSWWSAWLLAGLADSRSNGVLPRLQRVHGPAADVARPTLEVVADVVAPVPHDECSGERAQ